MGVWVLDHIDPGGIFIYIYGWEYLDVTALDIYSELRTVVEQTPWLGECCALIG